MLYNGGAEVLRLVFDGHLSNRNSWFSKERLAFSPYTDLKTSSTNYFEIHGWKTRYWFINKSYDGCAADVGWLVFTSPGHGCPWDPKSKFQIKYSRANTAQNWLTGSLLLTINACFQIFNYAFLLLQVMWEKQTSWLFLLTNQVQTFGVISFFMLS